MEKTSKWPKLPVAFKKKWIAALRSGKFQQGEGNLFLETGVDDEKGKPIFEYCCLGVACIVSGYDNKKISGYSFLEGRGYQKVPSLLRGDDSKNKLVAKLTEMNDGSQNFKRKTFPQIANWIDKNL